MPRHRLRDAMWASLHPKLAAIPGIWKSDAERLRRFVEAVAYVLRTGVAWEDLPEGFGKPNSLYRRYRRLPASSAGRFPSGPDQRLCR